MAKKKTIIYDDYENDFDDDYNNDNDDNNDENKKKMPELSKLSEQENKEDYK